MWGGEPPRVFSLLNLCLHLLQLADEDPKPVTDLAIQASRTLHCVCVCVMTYMRCVVTVCMCVCDDSVLFEWRV